MALFENFPYTNLHELNLDWFINELNRIKESAVLSVNGQTGDVVLYEDATVQFPNISENDWSIIRLANGTNLGIAFDNGIGYIVHGNTLNQIYSANNPPPYPVTSVNGQTGNIVLYSENTVKLPDLDDISLHNWNIFRNLNNVFRGIQFNDDGTAEIIDGLNRYQIYTANNQPPYPVTSVNGQTGAVALFTDNNAVVTFPAVTDPDITGWIIGRNLNGTPCYIQLNDDGTLGVTAGVNSYRVYTTDDTSADIINVPTDAITDSWGLIRTTSEGSVGILFSNDDQLTTPEAYIRYVDSMDVVHTEKLLTAADIPSASGVVSFNGQTGVVVVKGSDLIVSTTDTRTIAQAVTDLTNTDNDIKAATAYVENTDTATQNIPSGAYVIWKNNDYKSTLAISIGDTLSGTNLTPLSNGGITNDLRNDIDALNYHSVSDPYSSSDKNSNLGAVTVSCKENSNEVVFYIDVKTASSISASSTDYRVGYIKTANVQVPTGTAFTLGYSGSAIFVISIDSQSIINLRVLNGTIPLNYDCIATIRWLK